jgi:hypothetical protein
MAEDAEGKAARGVLERTAALLVAEADQTTVKQAARILSAVLGDRAEVGDASAYLFHYARSQGYNIPPYPLAGNGEIREFFADQGVEDVPSWYERIGIDHAAYERLPRSTIVAVRHRTFTRKAFLLPGVFYRQDSGFCGLEESGLIARMDDTALVALLDGVFDFLASDGHGPGTF